MVRISEKLDRALTRIAARTGKPRSYFVRKGLERIIEDAHDRLLAAEALKKSRGKTYSLREVEKRLGLFQRRGGSVVQRRILSFLNDRVARSDDPSRLGQRAERFAQGLLAFPGSAIIGLSATFNGARSQFW